MLGRRSPIDTHDGKQRTGPRQAGNGSRRRRACDRGRWVDRESRVPDGRSAGAIPDDACSYPARALAAARSHSFAGCRTGRTRLSVATDRRHSRRPAPVVRNRRARITHLGYFHLTGASCSRQTSLSRVCRAAPALLADPGPADSVRTRFICGIVLSITGRKLSSLQDFSSRAWRLSLRPFSEYRDHLVEQRHEFVAEGDLRVLLTRPAGTGAAPLAI
jgi:hypothetical protein